MDDKTSPDPRDLAHRIGDRILEIVSEIPGSTEPRSENPEQRGNDLTLSAALRAAAISGTLALPPGPVGILTILPDLAAIWRVQSQLVADIAASFGQTANLTRETMLYCLFRHAAAQAVRDLGIRVGERLLVKRASLRVMQKIAGAIGGKVTQRVIRSAVARLLPLVGALGVAAYAYYDTAQVGQTAVEYFSKLPNDEGEK